MTYGALLALLVLATAFTDDGTDEPGSGNKKASAPVWAQEDNIAWADSVLASLTLDEQIAQLFMVAAYSNKTEGHEAEIEHLVREYNVGGLIFFQGGPMRQADLTNRYQSNAKTPLLIAMDAEHGLGMRLDSAVGFPYQMGLGAIRQDTLLYRMGAEVARQCKRIGVHVNLAPVVDVNNNRNNPVINHRSFGEDVDNVTRKSLAYMQGMQDFGVLAVAKHFPGHGDTEADSHKTLPVIHHDRTRLDSVELAPFRKLIDAGIGGVMVAHMYVPALDPVPNRASTLSPRVVNDLLKEELGFKGLVFSDALNMREVTAFYNPGMVDVKAFLAGNDVLLFVQDVPTAVIEIRKAIERGEVSEEELHRRCRKILRAKAWAGLNKPEPVEMRGLMADLSGGEALALKHELIEHSVTLLRNEAQTLPISDVHQKKIAAVSIGTGYTEAFHQGLRRYANIDLWSFEKDPNKDELEGLLQQLAPYDVVIVSVHSENRIPFQNFGVRKGARDLVAALDPDKEVILDLFANPYALRRFKAAEGVEALIVSYQDDPDVNDLSAQLIFGGVQVDGRLPISASDQFPKGAGMDSPMPVRFGYTVPERLGISSSDLSKLEKAVKEGLSQKAYPGCQVLVAKEGKVIYNKSFGYHTYEHARPVSTSDIYDLASITKVASSTASLMRLVDEGLVSLDSTLGTYLPDWVDSTDYSKIQLRQMLAHQAGLISWIPFYAKTLHKGKPRFDLYSVVKNDIYDTRVAEDLYIRGTYNDTVIKRIVGTSLNARKKYKYSDLGYYFIQEIVKRKSGQPLNEYAAETFYEPLGLQTMGYLPRESHSLDRIVPTEYDMTFRQQLIHGDVHDPGAAMMGGVGGHAGLFANANDLAVMMQMFLNGGNYGGKNFVADSVVKHFTSAHFVNNGNRRGVGFDKPVRGGGSGPTCNCVSLESFGHSGFTGTLAWADPDEEVVYIFLSNRVYPDASNRKLISMGTRTRIQQAIYDAIDNAKEKAQ